LGEVVGACVSPSCLAGALDGGQQQAHQRADDGDHDEQFDKREAAATVRNEKACHGGVLCGQELRE